MIFRNSLYRVEAAEHVDNGVVYTISLNADHVIYKAHFPGEPITPGVCMLQIAVELLSDAAGVSLELSSVKNVKYLNVLHPDGTPVRVRVCKIEKNEGRVKAQVDFSISDSPIAKISLTCQTTVK